MTPHPLQVLVPLVYDFWAGVAVGFAVGMFFTLIIVALLSVVFRRSPFNGINPQTGRNEAWVLKERDRS